MAFGATVIRDMKEDRKMNFGELDALLTFGDDIIIMRNSRDDVIQSTNYNHLKITKVKRNDTYQVK
jgi:hypothetical protein